MDPMSRVRDYLLDNVGHMTYPGNPSFDAAAQRWFVPIYCRTNRGPSWWVTWNWIRKGTSYSHPAARKC
jgi:hypothetical protein